MLIAVHLTDADKWPHNKVRFGVELPPGLWQQWRGKVIYVSSPHPAIRPWEGCDDPMRWPVPEEANRELYRALKIEGQITHVVCRHQIQVGD